MSNYFKQSHTTLVAKRQELVDLLLIKGLKEGNYFKAFDYFVEHPDRYDGATGVKDLTDMKGLSLASMVHDWQYLHILTKYKGWKWFKIKTRFDWEYGQNLEALGKGIWTPYLRAIGLVIITPFYIIYKKLKK